MKIFKWKVFIIVALLIFAISNIAFAQDEVGKVAALKGRATIERDKKKINAKVKSAIFLKDTVSTLKSSRIKMRFADDSILTLGEKSKVVVKEFLYSKEKGGKSIFNFLDGKMRSIVGKTSFEVHTPTAVAAARGTVIIFEAGIRDGKKFTTIFCVECREVIVTNVDPAITGRSILTTGMIITIFEKEALPSPSLAPPEEGERLKKGTEMGYNELSVRGPKVKPVRVGRAPIRGTVLPPIEQQPGSKGTSVNINLSFQ